jgi:uncharacterized membrane protein YczE
MGSKLRRPIQYLLGNILVALGVVTLLKTEIGAGAWDTVTYNLSALTGLTLGISSFLIQSLIVIMITIYRKQLKYVLITVSILLISTFIDFWDLVVYRDYLYEPLYLQIVVFVLAVFVLTFGLSLIILTHYPAAIFDELMLMIMSIFKTEKIFYSRLFVEMFALFLATILGFIASIGFGAVNLGSFFLALFLPAILSRQLTWMRRYFDVKQT